MKTYTYSKARQKLSEVLDIARFEKVIIKRRSGDTFVVKYKQLSKSPFDVAGIKTKITTKDIINAVKESRSRIAKQSKEHKLV